MWELRALREFFGNPRACPTEVFARLITSIEQQGRPVDDVILDFRRWLARVAAVRPIYKIVTDNAQFDIAWLDHAAAAADPKLPPLSMALPEYFEDGPQVGTRYESALDISTFKRGLLSRAQWVSDEGALRELGVDEKLWPAACGVVHDHMPRNDAHYIAYVAALLLRGCTDWSA